KHVDQGDQVDVQFVAVAMSAAKIHDATPAEGLRGVMASVLPLRTLFAEQAVQRAGLAFHLVQKVFDAGTEVAVEYQGGDGDKYAKAGVVQGHGNTARQLRGVCAAGRIGAENFY